MYYQWEKQKGYFMARNSNTGARRKASSILKNQLVRKKKDPFKKESVKLTIKKGFKK
jgi:hypothetical protein